MEERRGLTIKGLLIRMILIVAFIFLLIWLFPTPNLKPLNNQIFQDNLDRMMNVAKTYYTVERLPENINDSRRMTLREMVDNKLILDLMDSNGKYCSRDKSYVEITKFENEYMIKAYLSCSDNTDYIVEHYGCYDFCSNKCKIEETTTNTSKKVVVNRTTKKTTKKVITTKKPKIRYEYQFERQTCSNEFDKYVCPAGYNLVGTTCIKQGSKVVTVDAKSKVETSTKTETKPATAVSSINHETVAPISTTTKKSYTIDATKNTKTKDKVVVGTQKVTATKIAHVSTKAAVATTTTKTANYVSSNTYDIISATKVASSYKWTYVSTRYSKSGAEAFVSDTEKLVLVDSYLERTCTTCASFVTVYKYYRYKKEVTDYSYTCDAFPGYELYDTNKCRKLVGTTKTCPAGYTDNGSKCVKKTTTYSCSSYGSDYVLSSDNTKCTKTTYTYSCPSGTTATSDQTVCSKNVYGCPSGTTENASGTCSYYTYSCPANTSTKSYTLSGTKCAVIEKVTTKTCPVGTIATKGTNKCVKYTTSTKLVCDTGYTLKGTNCTREVVTTKTVKYCDAGYTLSGDKCYKTVSKTDMKDAEKTYKKVCKKEYMWSTSTSVEGWSYTGNKRRIN